MSRASARVERWGRSASLESGGAAGCGPVGRERVEVRVAVGRRKRVRAEARDFVR